jgi:hypothetical protein
MMKMRARLLSGAVAVVVSVSSVFALGGPALASEVPVRAEVSQSSVDLPISQQQGGQNETQAVPVLGIIAAVIAVGGAYSAMGRTAGERVYHAGLRNAEYQKIKWQVRAGVIGFCGVVGGPIFMTNFENKFYSMR